MPDGDASSEDASILWRFSQIVELTPDEKKELASLTKSVRSVDPGASMHAEGDEPGLYFLNEGWALSTIDTLGGDRQVLKVHRPGDLMGTPSLPFAEAVETLTALTRCRVSVIGRRAIGALFEDWPRLSAVLFTACQVERVVLMDRLVAITRLDAAGSLVAFLLQLFRTKLPGARGDAIHLPLTQPQLGEVLGLTPVHVNRVVNRLERDGLIRREGHLYHLLDLERLEAIANMPRRTPEQGASWLPPPRRGTRA